MNCQCNNGVCNCATCVDCDCGRKPTQAIEKTPVKRQSKGGIGGFFDWVLDLLGV